MKKIDKKKTILVIDDSPDIIQLLTLIIEATGYNIVTKNSGEDGIAALEELTPDLILLDVMMPGIDGFETCKRIKANSKIAEIPLIFITGKTEGKDIAQGFELGAVDYISKPIFPQEVQARINVHLKLQDLIIELDEANKVLIEEQHIAKEIFDKFVDSGCLNISNIKYWLSPMSIFNGDLVVANRHTNGTLYVCLGDFTGHGLPASIGIIPFADAFYSMTDKGFTLQEITHEINNKLYSNLPRGIFCAACILTLDLNNMKGAIWNGSIPGVNLVAEDGTFETIKSKNLPLGILSPDQFNPVIEHFDLNENERFYMYTDGIVEASNKSGDRYSFDRVYDSYKNVAPDDRFDDILQNLHDFTGGIQDDDVTLLEVKIQQGDVTQFPLKEE